MNLNADVFLEFTNLRCLEREVVPARNRRIKIVIEERIAVTVIRSCPREQNALFIIAKQDFVSLVAVLQFVRHPSLFIRKPLRRKRRVEHRVGDSEVTPQHFTAELNPPVRIKIVGTPVFGNLVCKV